jgi:hypothetical protein
LLRSPWNTQTWKLSFSEEIAQGVKRSTTVLQQLALEALRPELDEMTSRVRQVMKQTRARIFRGNRRSEGKLLSLFEPSIEVIRKGKAGKPNEFGKMVKVQEAENQVVTDYEVYARRPYDSDLLVAAIETHEARLGRTPRLVAADAAFYSAGTRPPRRRWVSNASAFPIARARAPRADASRKNAGSATARNGAPDPRDASVWSSGATASPVCVRRSSPADFALPGTIVHNAAEANFAPGSS